MKKLNTTANITIFIILILSIVGIVDAGYLTYEHFSGGSVVCLVGEGCGTVTSSEYSNIAGIPVATLGLIYYALMFVLAIAVSIRYSKKTVFLVRGLVSIGLIFSLWFIYVQINLIEAICFYCMVSASLTAIMFITSWFLPTRDMYIKGDTPE